jgi:hypothetical protein
VPAVTPLIIPVAEPIVATPVFPDVQIPPVVESVKVDGVPRHILEAPVIDGTYRDELTSAVTVTGLEHEPIVGVTV